MGWEKNEVNFKGKNWEHLSLTSFEKWVVQVSVFSQFKAQTTEVILIIHCKLLKLKDNHFPSSFILDMIVMVRTVAEFCVFCYSWVDQCSLWGDTSIESFCGMKRRSPLPSQVGLRSCKTRCVMVLWAMHTHYCGECVIEVLPLGR